MLIKNETDLGMFLLSLEVGDYVYIESQKDDNFGALKVHQHCVEDNRVVLKKLFDDRDCWNDHLFLFIKDPGAAEEFEGDVLSIITEEEYKQIAEEAGVCVS